MDPMRHYSIWLEKYGKSRDMILGNLQGYKKDIDSVRVNISDKNLISPIAGNDRISRPHVLC